MLKRIVEKTGLLPQAISAVSTILPLPAAFLEIIDATMDFGAGDYFYLVLSEDELIEEVKVIDSTATYVVIERAEGGTIAQSFTTAATYSSALGVAAIQEEAANLAPVAPVTITGGGVVQVSDLGGGSFNISVTLPNITGQNGVEVTQAFPDYTIGLDLSSGCCAGDETDTGTGTPTVVVGAGIANVTQEENEYTVTVPSPNFVGAGIVITGAWPNLTFTAAAGAGGTVTSVAVGTGLALTGNPNVNPTINISNTGVVAGDYGGFVVNARGQVTAVPAGFAPVSAIDVTADTGLQVSRVGHTVTVAGIDAAEGVKGVVALADADVALDPDDATTAVTPKLLAGVVADIAGTEIVGGQTYSGEADADYTYVVPTTAIALDLAAGESALVIAHVTVRDNANPTVAQDYGMALFQATGARMQANKKLTQNNQTMMALVTGPFNDGVVLRTTAMPAGATVVSQSFFAFIL